MNKLKECLNLEVNVKLEKLRVSLLQPVYFWKMPTQDQFIQIRLKFPGESFMTSIVGQTCEIRVRHKKYIEAVLTSCTYRTILQLTDEDAIAAGYNCRTPLISLKAYLCKRFRENPHWRGDYTELEILSFRKL